MSAPQQVCSPWDRFLETKVVLESWKDVKIKEAVVQVGGQREWETPPGTAPLLLWSPMLYLTLISPPPPGPMQPWGEASLCPVGGQIHLGLGFSSTEAWPEILPEPD